MQAFFVSGQGPTHSTSQAVRQRCRESRFTSFGRTRSRGGMQRCLPRFGRLLMELVQPTSEPGCSAFTCRGHIMIGITSPAPLRVLVVDASVDITDNLAVLLNWWGCAARTAHDGPTALEAARAFRPDVLLMDIDLPGRMSGFDVARELRSRPKRTHALLVCVTDRDTSVDRRRLQQAGFEYHFLKPANLRELRLLLEIRKASRRLAKRPDNGRKPVPTVKRQDLASAV
jgi:CheY-like chemotaxis protein